MVNPQQGHSKHFEKFDTNNRQRKQVVWCSESKMCVPQQVTYWRTQKNLFDRRHTLNTRRNCIYIYEYGYGMYSVSRIGAL